MTRPGVEPGPLRCARCGRFVDWEEARLQVVCECRPHLDLPPVLVREATPDDRRAARPLFANDAHRAHVVGFGEGGSLDEAETLVADTQGEIGGALAWRLRGDSFHIVALATDPMWQRAGVGGYLMAEAELLARRRGCRDVVVTITNDNLPALYFCQRRGYRITAVLLDRIPGEQVGRSAGFAGIPIRDEIHLTKVLS